MGNLSKYPPINDCTNRSRSAAARAPMIPDLDIWRSANLLVKRHGPDAPIHAAMRADELLEAGIMARNYSRVAAAQSVRTI